MTLQIAFVALGANLDAPSAQVLAAIDALDALDHTRLLKASPLYCSEPVGYLDQPEFVNAVAMLETALAPQALLDALFQIEQRFGRERSFRNAPRTLDLDLLLHGEAVIETAALTLPHPRMHERAFVLLPLLDIAPDCIIPGCGAAADYLAACTSQRLQRLEG
ncbi:2-amino-4-hydroxy-6-hydroxymethyldihydropteridine diphosphokinase [Chitinivorax sp. PXF-14]|uniref:2-amino-4-hydroxy-6- hydroxymethyldihydropteridine diphosphokinase n=1 Tax=Chitinivorax sp. PXF-14 TaxID=3230488 RepID=UPI0034663EAE